MKSRLVFFMPKIDRDFFLTESLLERQNLYTSPLSEIQGNLFMRALLLYSGETIDTQKLNLKNLQVRRICSSRTNIFHFAFKCLSELRGVGAKKFIFVAGTPFQPLLVSKILHLFFPKSKVQVSIHGEVGGIKSNRIKSVFFRTLIGRVDAIRFVSDEQRRSFLREYSISHIPNVVAPVPIEIAAPLIKIKSVRSLGFVGRIHTERDPWLWAQIAEGFPDLEKIIVGEGPLRADFQALIPMASFYGQLKGSQLSQAWDDIGILLSTAPYESYGLALRESLLNGVPVVARSSAGARELEREFPNIVKLFNSKEEAVHHISCFMQKPPDLEEFYGFRKWFAAKQDSSLMALAHLWDSIGD